MYKLRNVANYLKKKHLDRCIKEARAIYSAGNKKEKEMWIKLRTTNVIERAFREVRRRTRSVSCFNNEQSIERIVYAVLNYLNEQ